MRGLGRAGASQTMQELGRDTGEAARRVIVGVGVEVKATVL